MYSQPYHVSRGDRWSPGGICRATRVSCYMDKFRRFLDKKAERTKHLRKNAREASELAQAVEAEVKEAHPTFGMGGEYSERYVKSITSKFHCLDRKVLPEYIDEAVEADIAKQRLTALENAEAYSSRYVARKRLEISGANYRIPEWAIQRDETVTQDATCAVRLTSMPPQFETGMSKHLDLVEILDGVTADEYSCGFSEPKMQGFHNEPTEVAYFPSDPEVAHKGFFKNYLEAARLCSKRPFYAYAEAQGREDHPIHTLVNRAKPLKPIFYSGSAPRPFPVEAGGRVFFVSGSDAEEMFELLGKEHRKYFGHCCIVRAERPKLSNKFIVEEMIRLKSEIADLEVEIDPIPAGVTPEQDERYKRWETELYNLLPSYLEELGKKGYIASKHAKWIEDRRPVYFRFPPTERFFYLLDADKRAEKLAEHAQRVSSIREELKALLGPDCFGRTGSLVAETSAFDDLEEGEDAFGCFFDEDAEEEAAEAIKSASEDEAVVDEAVELDNSLNFAGSELSKVLREDLEEDPRLISEIRLWPVSHKFWDPP